MTGNPMDRERRPGAALDPARFAQLLDAYGAAPERWPEAERGAALALLAVSEEARAARDAAARLDALLDLAPAEAPSAALVERVLAAAAPRGRRRRRVLAGAAGWVESAGRALWPGGGPVWRPAAALGAAAVLGLAIGLAVPSGSGSGSGLSDPASSEVDTLAFGGIALVESES